MRRRRGGVLIFQRRSAYFNNIWTGGSKYHVQNQYKRFTESAELNVCIDSSLYVHAQLAVHVHKANGKFLA